MFDFIEPKPPMDLTGGIDEYNWGKRFESEISPRGRKVKYLNENGYDRDREYANQFFKEGDILTIKEIYVGNSRSRVEFIEFEGNEFNTVMFEDVE